MNVENGSIDEASHIQGYTYITQTLTKINNLKI